MGAEQLADAPGNAHGRHALGQFTGHHATQAGQGVDHGLLAVHQLGGAGISPELALAGKPGHHHGRGKPEHDVKHDGGHVVAHAGAAAAVVATAQKAVHRIANDPAEEHHKGVHHALNQRHGDHVAIGHVGDFVADHGLNFFSRHALQQAGADRHQGRIFESTRGKGIGFAIKDANLGHADSGFVGKLTHGLDDPGLVNILWLLDDPNARGPLGHGLADQQRNEGAAKAHDQREAQQRAQVEAIGGEKVVDAKQACHNAQHHHHHHVG